MTSISSLPTLQRRLAHLNTLLANEARMLAELAQVAGVSPPGRLARSPKAVFGRLAAFADNTDFRTATEDARIWLHNRLGLYLARWFIDRHDGALGVQGDPDARFYLHFVVTGMAPPVLADARLAPFLIADDAIRAQPRIGLAALVGAAEAALAGSEAG